MLEFEKLQVDKENDEVSYNDENHTYWTKGDLQKCISVTTLIHKFSVFDEYFWSKYKALETLVNPEDFKYIKSDLLKTKVFNMNILKDLSIDEEVFNNQVDTILEEWRDKRERACARGTKIHKDYELKTLAGDYSALKEYNLPIFSDGGKFSVNTSNKIEEGYYVLPEALLSRVSDDGILRLAGQADLIIVNGNEVIILDYKSNAEIKTKSYFDRKKKKSEKMLYPLNHLDDVNYYHYELQLSTYAWIIEKNNPNLKVTGLYLLHHDHNDNKTVYKCEYRKDDVERMLSFYKKEIAYEDYKRRNKQWGWIK
jgi:hypothetical protein